MQPESRFDLDESKRLRNQVVFVVVCYFGLGGFAFVGATGTDAKRWSRSLAPNLAADGW